MTIESKWRGGPREGQPVSSVTSQSSSNENILATSLPSVKSQIQQWSKLQSTSDKKSSPVGTSCEATKISTPQLLKSAQNSGMGLDAADAALRASDTAADTITLTKPNSEPISSLETLPLSTYISSAPSTAKSSSVSIKVQETLYPNRSLSTPSEVSKKVPGRINSPFIDADSVQLGYSKETPALRSALTEPAPAGFRKDFSNSPPAGHGPTSTNLVPSKVPQSNFVSHQNIRDRGEKIEGILASNPFSDEQAVSDTSAHGIGLTMTCSDPSSKPFIQVPARPAPKSRPLPIYSKDLHTVSSLLSHSPPSIEQEIKPDTPYPNDTTNESHMRLHSAPEECISHDTDGEARALPRSAHVPSTYAGTNRVEPGGRAPFYTNTTASNNNIDNERAHKPPLLYRSNTRLPRALEQNEYSSTNNRRPIPNRPNVTTRQTDPTNDFTAKQELNPYLHRSKTVSTNDARTNIRDLRMQQKDPLASRRPPNPSVPLTLNNRNPNLADMAPMIPRKGVPISSKQDYEQKPAVPLRPMLDSYLPNPNLASRGAPSLLLDTMTAENKPPSYDPQGMASEAVPPSLPPKPALPQKWANNNFGQYNTYDTNITPDTFEPSALSRQSSNATDSDSNSDDGTSTTQQPLFPDQTYANVRAPELSEKSEAYTIKLQHKNPPKRFCITGHVVVTGNVAIKVWNMVKQEATTIGHEDGRVSSIAACPAVRVEDEGRRFWCGLFDGTLIEIDTETCKVTSRISSAHSSPVNHILRYKLQLWTIDDSGVVKIWTPNVNKQLSLLEKSPAIQIAKKQQVAIVVRNELWTAKDRNLNIYAYKSGHIGNSFEQVETLDIFPEFGNFTCLTKNREGTIVYSGHMDGKVMIWDTMTHSCVRVVPVSNYRICSLLCVRERYLWTGFATGRIYIYDMSFAHWNLVKSWDAHRSSPVTQLIFNSSSIFLCGNVQIASFAEDGGVKIWDGMLTRDWKEKEMLQRDAEFCEFRDIKVLICSWNIDASKPQNLEEEEAAAMESWLSAIKDPEIIVVGFQEAVNLESKKVTAKSILKFKNKSKSKTNEEPWTQRYKLWQDKLTEAIGRAGHQSKYELIHCHNLIGLFTCVFVKVSEKPKIQCAAAGKVKTGFGGLHGNKGAIAVRFLYEDSSFCFVNCHLAAGQGHVLQRNNDAATILQTSVFEPINGDKFVFVKGGNGTLITDHGLCFWSGDLNYRIDLPRQKVLELIGRQEWDKLYENDQLQREQSQNLAFMLRSFTEGPIQFAPTYKYNPLSNTYDTSEKQRIPAWCDRILYRGERIQQHSYDRHELTNSDHRPISAVFTATIKRVLPQVEKVQVDVEAAWANYMEKIYHHGMENWLVECGYPREIVKQVLERDYNITNAANFLNSQY